MPPIVLSPTPTVGMFGDSINVMFLFGNALIKVAAVIQPAEPPPTIKILFNIYLKGLPKLQFTKEYLVPFVTGATLCQTKDGKTITVPLDKISFE